MIEGEAPVEAPTRPRRRRLKRAIALFVLGLFLGIVGFAGYFWWAMGGSSTGVPVRVLVVQGDSAEAIAQKLASKSVIRSAFVFRIVARLRHVQADLKPGSYEMRTGLGVTGAIARLREGIPLQVERFSIPEGLTVREIAAIIGRETHVSAAEFLSALVQTRDVPSALAPHLRALGTPKPEDFEGFLFP